MTDLELYHRRIMDIQNAHDESIANIRKEFKNIYKIIGEKDGALQAHITTTGQNLENSFKRIKDCQLSISDQRNEINSIYKRLRDLEQSEAEAIYRMRDLKERIERLENDSHR